MSLCGATILTQQQTKSGTELCHSVVQQYWHSNKQSLALNYVTLWCNNTDTATNKVWHWTMSLCGATILTQQQTKSGTELCHSVVQQYWHSNKQSLALNYVTLWCNNTDTATNKVWHWTMSLCGATILTQQQTKSGTELCHSVVQQYWHSNKQSLALNYVTLWCNNTDTATNKVWHWTMSLCGATILTQQQTKSGTELHSVVQQYWHSNKVWHWTLCTLWYITIMT